MNITKSTENSTLKIAIEGRLDTTTAPQLEAELKRSIDGVQNPILDFKQLSYLSSAGLRAVLVAQKQMNTQGEMVLFPYTDHRIRQKRFAIRF